MGGGRGGIGQREWHLLILSEKSRRHETAILPAPAGKRFDPTDLPSGTSL